MTGLLGPAGNGPFLAFQPHLSVEPVPGEAVYLISDQQVTALHGAQIARLAPLLDGTRSLGDLQREAAGHITAEQTAGLVAKLLRAGLVCERPAGGPTAPQGYWSAAGQDGRLAGERLGAATVRALGPGGDDPAELRGALDAAGLRTLTGAQAAHADLTVVLCEDYLDPVLGEIDAAHRAAGRPWLPVRANGPQTWIGPFFGAVDGPCWSCLADRLWRGRQVEAHVQRSLERSGPAPRRDCSLPAARTAALQLAALEATKWLAGHRYPGQQALWSLDTLTLDGRRHPVTRRPECPQCGDPGLVAERIAAPVRLTSQPKLHTDGGGHRALSLEQVMERYGHHVDPLTGLVKEIRRDPRGPAALNCFHAGLNPVGGARGLASVRAGLRAHASGKGSTALQAEVGALAESLERYSGHLHGGEPVVRGRFRDLAADAVHPDAVQLFDPRQFAGRERWNADQGAFHQIADPFDEDDEIDWLPLWSLTEGRQKLLPAALLYYNAPQRAGRRYCLASSNGAAAGGTLEDAVLQGFLELVERDAIALWWYNRTPQPGIDLDAFRDPWIGRVRELHASLNREVWAIELTSDLGVPVVAAFSRRTDKPAEDIMPGFGAHLDPAVALRRALAEVNQLLPNVVDARADGTGYGFTDPQAMAWMQTAKVAELPYLAADPARPAGRPGPPPFAPHGDLLDDVTAAEHLVRRAGLEMLVLDQTRPEVGLPVAKVVVPGLRPHWNRFAPGRLFDVPVRLGRLAAPTPYDRLNPIPLFV
ncbi:TOMM precursor leader peptide-binding protein [Streptomyces sp. TLI_171]|uniref:TOMM precursor leader peptide-binding protein n=1 Tax=Streptomyces sp. TLI_171 TaxID=1938859 RepID=UPI000C1A20CA|nr:TOMM precursor leader peptide-binding protein [Streptomyces sp. TLI_171]RKE21264.1 ribosomal protein S12 methylthiotransferase accessory factor [Streptomyces sp. TLI_171]